MTADPSRVRVLLVGGDARTDALAEALAASDRRPELVAVAPFASPGLARRCSALQRVADLADTAAIVDVARSRAVDLAVIGPEAPLAAGLVDALRDGLGVASIGPTRSLARVETSKSFTRELLDAHAIAGNPRYRVFRAPEATRGELEDYVLGLGDVVVKPDGLTGGKGVKVLGEHLFSPHEAVDYGLQLLAEDGVVVVEERLEGEEFSLQSLADGESVVHCPPVQDHKRAFEGDAGPNTGGMGSYSDADLSLPFLEPGDLVAAQALNESVLEALAIETGEPYRGVLYGGFMATAEGIRLVEYNARFGDPEAMNVLTVFDGDWLEVFLAIAHGGLGRVPAAWRSEATVCKYVVPVGYPDATERDGELVVSPEVASGGPGARFYWSSVRDEGGRHLLCGSRALAAVGVGDCLAEAERRAESLLAGVSGPVRHRADIGTAGLVERRIAHMAALRGR